MNRLFKIVALVLAFGLAMPTCVWADPIPGASAGISVGATMTLMGSGTISVTPTARPFPAAVEAFTFDTSTVTSVTNSWVQASVPLRVNYTANSNGTYVGIRIVSKNGELDPTGAVNIGRTAVGRIAPGKANLDSDAVLENIYSGLIFSVDLDAGTTGEDPSRRGILAWQVYDTAPALITRPAALTSSPPAPRIGTMVYDKSTPTSAGDTVAVDGATWNAAWAYISDVDDEDFNNRIVTGTTATGDLIFGYPIVASGVSGSTAVLSQHPQSASPRVSTDGEIFIYIAARFANTNWGMVDTDPVRAIILPATPMGTSYTTRLYVELLHE